MRKSSRICLMTVKTLVACFMCLGVLCLAQDQNQQKSGQDNLLKRFLEGYLADSRSDNREPTRYSAAFVDLKGEGKREVIVYVTGDFFCGSGGCTTLILTPKDSTYSVVKKMPTTRLPIRVLTTKSNGWLDIGIMTRVWYGEGNVYAREEKLSYNGKSYRSSARRGVEKIAGQVVIPATADSILLFN